MKYILYKRRMKTSTCSENAQVYTYEIVYNWLTEATVAVLGLLGLGATIFFARTPSAITTKK